MSFDEEPAGDPHGECAAEIKRLEAWIDDLQSGMYVNCVYCGHRYGPGETTPVSMAAALKAHVEACASHPMAQLRGDRQKELKYIAGELRVIRGYNCNDDARIDDLRAWLESRRTCFPAIVAGKTTTGG